MNKTVIRKELSSNIKSFRFIIAFICSVILFTLTTIVGIKDYNIKVKTYSELTNQNREKLLNNRVYSTISPITIKKPSVLSIFSSRTQNDAPFAYKTNVRQPVEPYMSINTEIRLFNIISDIDILKVIGIFLSLFAIIFGFDTICNEYEKGTLKLVISTGIGQTNFLISKIAASMFALFIILLFSFLIALIVIVITIPDIITGSFMLSSAFILFLSLIYLSLFCLIGGLFSIITKSNLSALLYSLIVWVCIIFIYPIFSKTVAESIRPISGSSYIDAEKQIAELRQQINSFKVNVAGYLDIDYQSGIYKVQILGDTSSFYRFRNFISQNEPVRQKINTEIEKINTNLLLNEYSQYRLINQLNIFNPYLLYRSCFENICFTSVDYDILFYNLSLQYKNKVLDYLKSKDVFHSFKYFTVISEEELSRFDENLIPKWVKLFHDYDNKGTPLPSHELEIYEPLELNGFPEFDYSNKNLSASLWKRVLTDAAKLFIITILLFVVSIIKFERSTI